MSCPGRSLTTRAASTNPPDAGPVACVAPEGGAPVMARYVAADPCQACEASNSLSRTEPAPASRSGMGAREV